MWILIEWNSLEFIWGIIVDARRRDKDTLKFQCRGKSNIKSLPPQIT
jgi:hypothetical protein